MKSTRILMVCTGNICRSPTAAVVLQHHAAAIGLSKVVQVDSAATHGYHTGKGADSRTIYHARQRGYDLSAHRARQIRAADFMNFDVLLAMDAGHLAILENMRPAKSKATIALYLPYAGLELSTEVPDPYYGFAGDFEMVLDLTETATLQILSRLTS